MTTNQLRNEYESTMTSEQYLYALQALRDRQNALDQEKAQLNQDYLDSLPP